MKTDAIQIHLVDDFISELLLKVVLGVVGEEPHVGCVVRRSRAVDLGVSLGQRVLYRVFLPFCVRLYPIINSRFEVGDAHLAAADETPKHVDCPLWFSVAWFDTGEIITAGNTLASRFLQFLFTTGIRAVFPDLW